MVTPSYNNDSFKKNNLNGTIDLLLQKKLALFLDIDNTFLHAVVLTQVPFSLLQMEDIIFFPMENDHRTKQKLYCLVKLRPGVIDFLRYARKLFKIYICTLGNRNYAKEIRDRLNLRVASKEGIDNLEAIEPLIISREHHMTYDSITNKCTYQKNLRDILSKNQDLSFNENVIVVVDDRFDIWYSKDAEYNLVRIHPYSFFFQQPIYEFEAAQHGLNNTKPLAIQSLNLDINDREDKCLMKIYRIILEIHKKYFAELIKLDNTDLLPHVYMFIKDIREKVFKDLVFYPRGEKLNSIMTACKLFGAEISDELGSHVTHVICDKDTHINENEFQNINNEKIYYVKKAWIIDSMKYWERVDEKDYLLKTC